MDLAISNCLLEKLAKNYDESTQIAEFDLRKRNLESNIGILLQTMRKMPKSTDISHTTDIISSLIILILELKTKGEWNGRDTAKQIKVLEHECIQKYQIDPLKTLTEDSAQEIFESCLEKLHKKLTTDDFKKYPSMIEVYYKLLLGVKDYKIKIYPYKTLPASLVLINDYIPENKIKGLACCEAVLKCLVKEDFKLGNYYEVMYKTLHNVLREKKLEMTKLVCSCMLALVKILPLDVQTEKCEEFISSVIEEISVESNFYRKKALFEVLHKIISLHGVECVALKTSFFELIIQNFNDCKVKEVKDVILYSTLQCLSEWIKYCWCVWCYQTDHKVLSSLFLILYLLEKEESENISYVQNIIITLIRLSLEDEQDEIVQQMSECGIKSPEYKSRIEYVQAHLYPATLART